MGCLFQGGLGFFRWKKICSGGLIFSVLFEVWGAPIAQASLWQSRRQLRSQQVQVAALNLPQPAVSAWLASVGGAVNGAINLEQKNLVSSLPIPTDLVRKIFPYGEVVDADLNCAVDKTVSAQNFLRQNSEILFVVQDAHQVQSAQRNIAFLSANLIAAGVSLVAMEGASGPIAFLDEWRASTNDETRLNTAGYFARLGYITGAETAVLSSSQKNLLVRGVENKAEYQAQVDAFKASIAQENSAQDWQNVVAQKIEQLQKKWYSSTLMRLTQSRGSYEQGQMPLSQYLMQLREYSKKEDAEKFKNVWNFIELCHREKKLDAAQLQNFQQSLSAQLAQKLKPDQARALAAAALGYRLNQSRADEFYALLNRVCRENQIKVPDLLQDYFDYVRLSASIDKNKFLDEAEEYDRQVRQKQLDVLSANARRLEAIAQDFSLAQKALKFSLTPKQWRQFDVRQTEIADLAARLNKLDAGFNVPENSSVRETLENVKKFSELSVRRDAILLSNTLSQMRRSGKHSAILVVGGWHSAGIQTLLKAQKVNYVVVRPKIENVGNRNDPLEFFRREKTDLEKLFQPEKLSLAPPPGSLQPYVQNLSRLIESQRELVLQARSKTVQDGSAQQVSLGQKGLSLWFYKTGFFGATGGNPGEDILVAGKKYKVICAGEKWSNYFEDSEFKDSQFKDSHSSETDVAMMVVQREGAFAKLVAWWQKINAEKWALSSSGRQSQWPSQPQPSQSQPQWSSPQPQSPLSQQLLPSSQSSQQSLQQKIGPDTAMRALKLG